MKFFKPTFRFENGADVVICFIDMNLHQLRFPDKLKYQQTNAPQ